MENVLLIIAAAVAIVAAVAVYFIMAGVAGRQARDFGKREEEFRMRESEFKEREGRYESQLTEAGIRDRHSGERIEALLRDNASLEARLQASEDNVKQLRQMQKETEEKLAAQHKAAEDRIESQHKAVEERLENQRKASEERMESQHREALARMAEQHARELEQMKENFKVTASEILSANSREFKEQSAGKIADLLGPVREKFDEFRKSVESSEKTSVAVKTSLEEQIRSLVEQSGKVGDEARNLANALTSRSKVQGDFGEMILKDILLNAGLAEGIHFQCQGVMTDEDGREIKSDGGKTMIPDVLVFYPDNTMVVIDSKVSLTDYVAYVSASDENARDKAAARHMESVRKHINELADKNYASYVPSGKRKVDYNIMFIPNEGAFQLMLEKAPRLWQEARDRNVLIVSQMTLLIVLNMIQMVWKQAEREKNVDNIVAAASELMGQLGGWLDIYAGIGDRIAQLSKAYGESTDKLSGSRQSVIQKIRKLEKLGAAPKRGAVKTASRKSVPGSVIPAVFADALPPEVTDGDTAADA